MYKFYPILNHVACISAQAVAASVASAVMGESSISASSISVDVSLPQQPRQPPTKPISSRPNVQATHSQKRRVEEKEKGDEPAAKQHLISKQGRFLRSVVSWLF